MSSDKQCLRVELLILLLAGLYLFVLPLPNVVTVREGSLFLAIFLTIVLKLKERRWEWPPVSSLLLLLLLSSLISVTVSHDAWFSLSEIKKDVIYPVLAFVLFYTVTKGKREFVCLAVPVFFSAFLILTASYVSYYFLGLRYEDLHFSGYLYGSKAYYVFILLAVSSLCVPFIISGTANKILRICSSVLIPLCLVGMYIAKLRAGYLAVVVAVSVYLIYTNFIRKSFKRKAIILVCMLVIGVLTPGLIASRNFSLNLKSYNTALSRLENEERIVIWKKSLREISDNPVFGKGFGNKNVRVVLENKLIDYPEVESYTLDSHNLFLNYGLMSGVGGSLVLVLVFGRVFWLLHGRAVYFLGGDKFMFGVALFGLLLLAVFISMNLTSDIMTRHCGQFFWALMGMVFGAARLPDEMKGTKDLKALNR